METTTSQLTPAGQSPALALATGSASSKRRFVTVVYEIKDDAAWRDGGNPLHYEHHGLKSVCVSAGDLASLNEEIEAIVHDGEDLNADKYDELHTKHVMSSFPGR
jgi:hypothetical protein